MKTHLHFLFLILATLFFNSYKVNAQSFTWVKGVNCEGGVSSNPSDSNEANMKTFKGSSIAVDAIGNSYVIGTFIETGGFGSIHLTAVGSDRGPRNSEGKGIAIDAMGNSFITGHFIGPASFGTVHLDGFGGFIAKYDPNGNCIWAKLSGNGNGLGISIDTYGNSYVTGGFKGTATFGTIKVDSFSYDDIFIARYDPNGICLWAIHAGGIDFDYGNGISNDANGNCYVTGYFSGNVKFGEKQLSSSRIGAFITKINISK